MKKLLRIVVQCRWAAKSLCEIYSKDLECNKEKRTPLNDLLIQGYKIISERLVSGITGYTQYLY